VTASQRRQRSERRFLRRTTRGLRRITNLVSRSDRQREQDLVLDQRRHVELAIELDRINLVILEFFLGDRLARANRLHQRSDPHRPRQRAETALTTKLQLPRNVQPKPRLRTFGPIDHRTLDAPRHLAFGRRKRIRQTHKLRSSGNAFERARICSETKRVGDDP